MANVENIEKRILKLVDTDSPCAIALTGEWGVGKTHLWKKIRDENKKVFAGKKYAYISLFGLDSLESLKLAIATEVHIEAADDSLLNVDVSKHLKKLFGFVGGGSAGTSGDMRFGINIGNKLVTNIIMSHLKNTLVCLDDIERKSDSLPISEILGLVNYLRNERKCQVLMIAHDEESEDKKYFDKYKEKVFDEVLTLDDSLSIIKDPISNVETFPIYEKFYQTMGVKNLRFYQTVQDNYEQITKHSNSLSQLSKEEILKQLLIITSVHDMPDLLGIDMELFQTYFSSYNLDKRFEARRFSSKEEVLELENRIEKAQKTIEKFHKKFRLESWANVVIDALTNLSIDEDIFGRLAERDLLEHTRLDIERRLFDLDVEFRSLVPKTDYNQRLFQAVKDGIYTQNLNTLSRHCNALRYNGEPALSDELIDLVKTFIHSKVSQDANNYNESYWYPSGVDNDDIFYDHLSKALSSCSSNIDNKNKYYRLFDDYFHNKIYDEKSFDHDLLNINKSELKDILWKSLSDERDRKSYIAHVLRYPLFRHRVISLDFKVDLSTLPWKYSNKHISLVIILSIPIYVIKKDILRRWILELLQEKIEENPNSRAPIEMWLKATDNLNII
ncbi:P-loop NTPase fold protein [Psychrobacter sp. 1U1]|uniref:P-loop NTPase fold protein n=1 Tax=Psychrobacter sp. 1U1 TaxID=3453576 RepID=UPI003F45FCFE